MALTAPPTPVLELSLTKRLGAFSLDVTLTAHSRRLVIWGHSGAGKSLTLRMIAGLAQPDAGRLAVEGRVLHDSQAQVSLSPQTRGVGLVFQDFALFPHYTVAQNLAFGLGRAPEAAEKVKAMARRMEVERLLNQRPAQLSGGQRQRVALGRALLAQPRLLLLDEPFSSLDSGLRARLRQEFADMVKGLDLPIILVTHDPEDVRALAQGVAIFRQGRCQGASPLPRALRLSPPPPDDLLPYLEQAS
ncbi:MAG: ATP-binding cassette domain-containing protein [Desulfarculus sp.]|nr:ATP-binding cassette domain-containing protein [Desulfarculus sp.]